MTHLLEGHKRFYQKYFVNQPELYKQLVAKGQSPKTLVVSCSDSRVDPAILLDTEPGDVFVIRNVASLIPPYEKETGSYPGVASALEFAVKFIKVENILLIGHSQCAGMKTLLKGAPEETDFIEKWVSIGRETSNVPDQDNNPEKSLKYCTEGSLKVSLGNLMTYPWLADLVEQGKITLHARYFDMTTGHLNEI